MSHNVVLVIAAFVAIGAFGKVSEWLHDRCESWERWERFDRLRGGSVFVIAAVIWTAYLFWE